ncbi:MAG: DMT family transporter [Bdellovibrionota bacterium]
MNKKNLITSQENLARIFLLFATALWGMSFPIVKALRSEFYCAPASEFTQSAAFVFFRFFLSFVAFTLWVVLWKKPGKLLLKISKKEFFMGAAIGIVGGMGLLFQGDGLAFTDTSTSAFLTQMTCILVPLITFLRGRRRLSGLFNLALLIGFTGIYLISGLELSQLRLGRGEAETLIAAVFFTAQILLLESKRWGHLVTTGSTWVMFLFFALVNLPFFNWSHFCIGASPNASVGVLLFFSGVLVVFCSLLPYALMNLWQAKISGTEATFIYSLEAIFTIGFNFIWIPILFQLGGYQLELEVPSLKFSVGALFLILANVFLFAESYLRAKKGVWKI